MHEDKVDRLYKLLVIHEKLLGHPKLGNVRGEVEKELATLNDPEKEEDDRQAPLFPKDSAVVQTDTERRIPR